MGGVSIPSLSVCFKNEHCRFFSCAVSRISRQGLHHRVVVFFAGESPPLTPPEECWGCLLWSGEPYYDKGLAFLRPKLLSQAGLLYVLRTYTETYLAYFGPQVYFTRLLGRDTRLMGMVCRAYVRSVAHLFLLSVVYWSRLQSSTPRVEGLRKKIDAIDPRTGAGAWVGFVKMNGQVSVVLSFCFVLLQHTLLFALSSRALSHSSRCFFCDLIFRTVTVL